MVIKETGMSHVDEFAAQSRKDALPQVLIFVAIVAAIVALS